MKFTISAAVFAAATAASAQGIEIKSADFTLGYRVGETRSSLPISTTQIGIGADIGFSNTLGINVDLAYLTNNPNSAFPYDYTGFEILLNPYWDISDSVRLGAFYDNTTMNYGMFSRDSTAYGLTGSYKASDRLMIDGYAGFGRIFLAGDSYILGAAANYSLGNGWAIGARVDYQEFEATDSTRVGLASSYTFNTSFSSPLTITVQYDYETTTFGGSDNGISGISISVPFGGESRAIRPTKNRRGNLVDRPVT